MNPLRWSSRKMDTLSKYLMVLVDFHQTTLQERMNETHITAAKQLLFMQKHVVDAILLRMLRRRF